MTQIFCGDTAHVLPRSSKDLHGRDWLVRKHLSYVAQRLQASCREVAALVLRRKAKTFRPSCLGTTAAGEPQLSKSRMQLSREHGDAVGCGEGRRRSGLPRLGLNLLVFRTIVKF